MIEFIVTFILIGLIVAAISAGLLWLVWRIRRFVIDTLQKWGARNFRIDIVEKTDEKTKVVTRVMTKVDLNPNRICILVSPGMEYRIGVGTTATEYFLHDPNLVYLKWVLPHRDDPYEQWEIIELPNGDPEAARLDQTLRAKQPSIKLTPEELTILVNLGKSRIDENKNGFKNTDHLDWWQKWCLKNAGVYWFWEYKAKKQLISSDFINSKMVPGSTTGSIEFIERIETSVSFSAKKDAYGGHVDGAEDADNNSITFDYVLIGRNVNPFFSDFKVNGVFGQIRVKGKSCVEEGTSHYSYLAKTTGLEQRLEEFKKIESSMREPVEITEDKPSQSPMPVAITKTDESQEDKKKRLIQTLKTFVIPEMNKPENYLGFVWDDIEIFNFSVSKKLQEKQAAAAESLIDLEVTINKAFGERVEGLAANQVEYDRKKKEAAATAYAITEKGKADAATITAINNAQKAWVIDVLKPMVDSFGKENSAAIASMLNMPKLYDALKSTQSNIILSANPQGELGDLLKKHLINDEK